MESTGALRRAAARLWPALYLAAVTVGVFAAFRAWAYDDPFITYRYAVNLAHGAGFVYNPGEPVLSTTTPLLTILLAALTVVSDDLPAMANLLGAVALAGGGLCLWDLSTRAGSRWGGLAGLTLYPTFGLVLSTTGSETPLYLFFCLAALAAYGRERYAWTAVACALAVLARPDGALVALVVTAHYLVCRRPSRLAHAPWPAALLFVVLLLPWLLFSLWQFGSPFPATLFAKQQQGIMAISERFAPGLLRAARNYTTPFPHLIAAPLIALGLVALIVRARALIPLFVWTAAYVASYSLLGVTSYFWYYAPLIPASAVAVGLGLEAVQRAASRWPRAAVLVCGALLVTIFAGQLANAYRQSLQPDRRMIAYTAVGRWLATNTPPQASVGMLEVGVIGYYSQRPIVDFAGLIQPEVAAQLGPNSTYDDAGSWAMNRYRPAYVALPDGALPRLDAYVTGAGCQVAQRFPGAAFAFRFDMTVYKCSW